MQFAENIFCTSARRRWLIVSVFVCLALLFYIVGYWIDPSRPGASAQHPEGWWGWFDQGQYYRSLVALEQDNYDPSQHHYPIGYPLTGMLFYPIMPQHAFFIPDLVCYGVICAAFVGICRKLFSLEESLLLCFFGVVWPAAVRGNLIRPWTNTPVHAALMVLAYLALAGRRDRVAGIATGICAGLIFMMRPGDLMYCWPMMAALWLDWQDWRDAWHRAAWFISGALPLIALSLYFSIAIHGNLISKSYRAASMYVGFGVSSLGVKLYTFLIDGFPLFGERRTLVSVFPLLLLIVPGLVVFLKEFRWRGAVIVATQAAAVFYFLAYNDYWISSAFKYFTIRYWLWLIPFLGLYAYMSFRLAWSGLGRTGTSLLLAVPIIVWIVPRMNIRPVTGEDAPVVVSRSAAGTLVAAGAAGSGWICHPDPDGSCNLSLEFPKPERFDILEFRGTQAINLLYARLWIDGRENRMFHNHILSDAPDGQTYVIFYRQQQGRSIRLTIPPQSANEQLSLSDFQLGLRETKLGWRNPFVRFRHVQ